MNEYEYIKNQASSRSLLLEFLSTGAHLLKNQYLKKHTYYYIVINCSKHEVMA